MAQRHNYHTTWNGYLFEVRHGKLAGIVVEMLPHSAQRNQVERTARSGLHELGKAVIQPLDHRTIMQRDPGFAKLFDGFDRKHSMPLRCEPHGVAACARANVGHADRRCR
ncbi:hypothetical protein BV97_01975 [Novosphingobium resinovorum]|uniref:Uncharacterized protein n=1 Tax=Novosphingobium resinovorum TaxID=158500 RepID=A0A031K0C8_9SPHN|nr:hypothetical protein BV97_01975 [Novosphingobium resinovorum]